MLDIRVSAKQAVSIYGLQKFPVTLYREQWMKILADSDQLRTFIAEHDAELKRKDDKAFHPEGLK